MDDVTVNAHLTIPGDELEMSTSRSGGPGGQNVNRRETRVELVWNIADSETLTESQRARLLEKLASRLDSSGRLRIVSTDERSQLMNREIAVERLQAVVHEALKVRKPRKATRPSKSARERRLVEKRARSEVKRSRAKPAPD